MEIVQDLMAEEGGILGAKLKGCGEAVYQGEVCGR